jgi:hypothetical protein
MTEIFLSSGTLQMSGRETILRPKGSLKISNPRELLVAYRHRGAYSHDGRVVRDTQRLWGLGRGECPDPVPDHLAVEKAIESDVDEVVWGGFFTFHYGHFLSESVARLWPLLPGGELEGMPVVFSTSARAQFITEWDAAFGLNVVEPPASSSIRFTRAYIPEPAWKMSAWISPEMRDIHLHARNGMDVPHSPHTPLLWMSRTLLEPNRRVRDEALCQWLLRDRVKVIHPEKLSLAEQIAEIEACGGMIGPIGSAFHTLLLARHIPECIYLSPSRTASSFAAQDCLLGDSAKFIHALANDRMASGSQDRHPYRLLIPETLRALTSTLLPDLLDDPRLARLAFPERNWSSTSRSRPGDDNVDVLIGRIVLDPNRIGARMDLGGRLEEEGVLNCALEQFVAVAELAEEYAYASIRAARVLSKLRRLDEAAAFARQALAIDPDLEEARGYVEAAGATD